MRQAQNLTQSELAEQTGLANVDASTISRIEHGLRTPGLGLGIAFARVFGVPAEVLFTEPHDQKAAA